MKKIFLLLIVSLIGAVNYSFAQDERDGVVKEVVTNVEIGGLCAKDFVETSVRGDVGLLFDKSFTMGAGIGLRYQNYVISKYRGTYQNYKIPIYAKVKYDLAITNKTSLFFSSNIGVNIKVKGEEELNRGFFMEPSVGLSLKAGANRVNLSLAYSYFKDNHKNLFGLFIGYSF